MSTAGIEPDPEIQPVVARYEARLDEELGVPVGTTTVTLDSAERITTEQLVEFLRSAARS